MYGERERERKSKRTREILTCIFPGVDPPPLSECLARLAKLQMPFSIAMLSYEIKTY